MLPKLTSLIVAHLGVNREDVKPAAKFMEDLGADSLDMVELCMGIEEEFAVEIPDTEAEKIQTVQDVLTLLEEKCVARDA